MNINSKKTNLKKRIDLLDERKLAVLDRYMALLEGKKAQGWDDISEAERAGIEKGLKDAENGDFIAHEEVMEKYKKWR